MKGSILFDNAHNLEINFTDDEKNITNLADGEVYEVGTYGNFEIAEVTINNYTVTGSRVSIEDGIIVTFTEQTGVFNIPLYKGEEELVGKQALIGNANTPVITGDAVYDPIFQTIIVSGNCTITGNE